MMNRSATPFEKLIRLLFFFSVVGLTVMLVQSAQAQPLMARVKDIAKLDGVQDNPLIGYGLVGGLEGTGDGPGGFTAQTLNNLLAGMGINVIEPDVVNAQLNPANVAAVMVMADLPPFARPGSRVDASVISIGQAESLQGGTLFTTPLKGADGKVHGVAQGAITIGGFQAAAGGGGPGQGAASVQQNHTLVGTIPNGMIIEGEPVFHNVLQEGNTLRWLLKIPDFKTASNLQRAINAAIGGQVAFAEDAGAVRVQLGLNQANQITIGEQSFNSLVDAIAFIDELEVATDEPQKIIINERTGTIVAGNNIRVRNAVIAHGPLRITIRTTPEVTPGAPGAGGATTVDQAQAAIEEGNKVATIEGTTIGEVVNNLNALGYTPRDLIAILQAMKAAGYIKADIEMM